MQNTKKISLLKAVSWQTLGIFSTLITTWIVTGSISLAGNLTFAMTSVAFVMYFLHERVWARFTN
ncbi:DUF2061 domain-containing protein [Sneathiella sp. P13V-1]|uniref:DUF2061 domain-containing protein n=1 Tax=Sneathiella sp. P13V-1 TaxID=2697366 RepID=UPI00187B996F|nr:DUF2061 domain-containing protein [Sneathiella sp. P13V-1]MBE7636591.1 DUF2061 domain-containing protein [Sneathiella sp. P13V-1]